MRQGRVDSIERVIDRNRVLSSGRWRGSSFQSSCGKEAAGAVAAAAAESGGDGSAAGAGAVAAAAHAHGQQTATAVAAAVAGGATRAEPIQQESPPDQDGSWQRSPCCGARRGSSLLLQQPTTTRDPLSCSGRSIQGCRPKSTPTTPLQLQSAGWQLLCGRQR